MKKIGLLMLFILIFSINFAYANIGHSTIPDVAIYENPDYNSNIVQVLKLNSYVEILETQNNWYKIKTSSEKTGWIETSFISAKNQKYVVNNINENINIRKSPTVESDIVGQLEPGQKAKYIDTYHSWYIIEFNNSEYYIASWFPDLIYESYETIYVIYDSTIVRESPNTSSNALYTASKSESFEVIEEKNGWLKIYLKDARTGYIPAWLTSYDHSLVYDYSYARSSDNLNLRMGTTIDYDLITTLPVNSLLKVIETENNWSKVITEDGLIGWCNTPYIEEVLPLSGKSILLDPGHGGRDPGSTSYSGKQEKYINLEVAYKLKEILESNGATVYMTRTDNDTYLKNSQRGRMADNLNVDILLSIHHNSFSNNNYFGLSTYYNTINTSDKRYGYDLAESIYLSATTVNGVYKDGILNRNFEVLRETNTPAALIEIGFMSNPIEEMNIHDSTFQDIMVQKIAQGIINYFK